MRQRCLAHAAIDVSDGLLADLGHLLKRSGAAAELPETQLPPLPFLPQGVALSLARTCQLSGGDDYELIFAAAPENRQAVAELAAELELPLWRFGRVIEGVAGTLTRLDENGAALPITHQGYDHFGQTTD